MVGLVDLVVVVVLKVLLVERQRHNKDMLVELDLLMVDQMQVQVVVVVVLEQ
jgi:hypothetical protein